MTTSGSREIDISSITDRVNVDAVEYPVDKFPKNYQRFSLWGDTLTLLGPDIPDGSNAYVYYGKLHTLSVSTSTIATSHEELVAVGAGGYAATEWAIYAVNSTNVGGRGTPEDFRKWGQGQLAQFRREIRRLGRRGRIRMRSFYGAYYPPVSQMTDYGPAGG